MLEFDYPRGVALAVNRFSQSVTARRGGKILDSRDRKVQNPGVFCIMKRARGDAPFA